MLLLGGPRDDELPFVIGIYVIETIPTIYIYFFIKCFKQSNDLAQNELIGISPV